VERWQAEPYRTTDRVEVLACEPTGDARFRVRTTPTILYPEGGGQPADHGTIGGVRVVDVQKDAGGVVHVAEGPVALGGAEVVVDWARRFDHMQQHTGQHLLTAVLHTRHGVPTTSFHLGADVAYVDLGADRLPLTLDALEAELDAEILAARPISDQECEAHELGPLGVRSRGLPDGFAGRVRLVRIEGVDLNTCGGTHLRSTAELQTVKLLGVEKVRGAGLRLSFLYGGRVRRRLGASLAHEERLNRLLSVGVEGHVAAIERATADARDASRRLKAAEAELAGFVAERLATTPGPVIAAHREGADLRVLQGLAAALAPRRPDALLFLTADDGSFLLAGDPDAVARLGPEVATRLGGRGGGGKGRFQGKAERIDARDAVTAWLVTS
jgi:Ser-tRNA(Ala) deacylase AlaX